MLRWHKIGAKALCGGSRSDLEVSELSQSDFAPFMGGWGSTPDPVSTAFTDVIFVS